MSSEIAVRAEQTWTKEQERIIREMFADGCTDDELAVLLYQAKRRRLDPLSGQIRGIKRWNAQKGRQIMTVQTSIDAFRLIAQRTGTYGAGPAPEFRVEMIPNQKDKEGNPLPDRRELIARVTLRKLCGNREAGWTWLDVTDEARWSEYVQTKQDGSTVRMWQQMPHNQLGKCAEAKTLRRGWPEELGGMYTDDEMGQADNPPDTQAQAQGHTLRCMWTNKTVGCALDAVEGSNFCQQHSPERQVADGTDPETLQQAHDREQGQREIDEAIKAGPYAPAANKIREAEAADIGDEMTSPTSQAPAEAEPAKFRCEVCRDVIDSEGRLDLLLCKEHSAETTFHTPDKHQAARLRLALAHDPKLQGEDKAAWVVRAGACPDARAFDNLCLELEKAVGLDVKRGVDGLPI